MSGHIEVDRQTAAVMLHTVHSLQVDRQTAAVMLHTVHSLQGSTKSKNKKCDGEKAK